MGFRADPHRSPRVLAATIVVAGVGLGVVLLQSGVLTIRGETVTFESAGATLHGTIAFPRWKKGPFPAAVIVHGSGRNTWKDMRGYARRLVPNGIAVLMYDKRGVGRSEGIYNVIRIADSERSLSLLADDAAAALDVLAAHPAIDATRVGLVGGSQAGWIMPLAATRNGTAAYIVGISAPAVTYGQEIHYSRLTGDDPGPFSGLSDAEIERRLDAYDGPHGYDPLRVLERLAVPSLWILGGADPSVPTKLSVANLNRLRADRQRAPIDIELFADGDHSIRHAVTGQRLDYWPRITAWLERRRMSGKKTGQP